MQRPSVEELENRDHFYRVPERGLSLKDRIKKIGSNIVDWMNKPTATIEISTYGSAYEADVDMDDLVELHSRHPELRRADTLDFKQQD